jgi:hypothetical protein
MTAGQQQYLMKGKNGYTTPSVRPKTELASLAEG